MTDSSAGTQLYEDWAALEKLRKLASEADNENVSIMTRIFTMNAYIRECAVFEKKYSIEWIGVGCCVVNNCIILKFKDE